VSHLYFNIENAPLQIGLRAGANGHHCLKGRAGGSSVYGVVTTHAGAADGQPVGVYLRPPAQVGDGRADIVENLGIQTALAFPMPPEIESQSGQATLLPQASELGVVLFATGKPVADDHRRVGRLTRWQIQMPGQGQAVAFKVELLPLHFALFYLLDSTSPLVATMYTVSYSTPGGGSIVMSALKS
jgi:hypothetical protein